jgi:hypothetical protein
MNTTLVTTGLVPLTVGSVEQFQLDAVLDGLHWDLTGAAVNLLMTDPLGNSYNFIAAVQNQGAVYAWVVPNVPGTWVRAWKVVDALGRTQVSRPIVFTVVSSPS